MTTYTADEKQEFLASLRATQHPRELLCLYSDTRDMLYELSETCPASDAVADTEWEVAAIEDEIVWRMNGAPEYNA